MKGFRLLHDFPLSQAYPGAMRTTVRRECLDQVSFWNAVDLARQLREFTEYYNAHRVHRTLAGSTPVQRAGAPSPVPASLDYYAWHQHCRDLFQTPTPA